LSAVGRCTRRVENHLGRPEIETDEVRERRISIEAVVDAYDEQERAIG